MASFNKVILIGHLTADPELRHTAAGRSVTSFSIGVNRRFSKEAEQNVDFINCVAWEQRADFITRYFKKGVPILVCGQIQNRSWTDNQGQKRYATEVIVDDATFVQSQTSDQPAAARGTASAAPYTPYAYAAQGALPNAPGVEFEEITNDGDLPF